MKNGETLSFSHSPKAKRVLYSLKQGGEKAGQSPKSLFCQQARRKMVSAPSPQSQGSPVSCLIQVWSWVFLAQSHIQYSAVNKSMFSTHADNHPALVSRTSQRREGENVTFRGHLLIPFCFIPLSFRKTTNPPHHVEVEILWGGE